MMANSPFDVSGNDVEVCHRRVDSAGKATQMSRAQIGTVTKAKHYSPFHLRHTQGVDAVARQHQLLHQLALVALPLPPLRHRRRTKHCRLAELEHGGRRQLDDALLR